MSKNTAADRTSWAPSPAPWKPIHGTSGNVIGIRSASPIDVVVRAGGIGSPTIPKGQLNAALLLTSPRLLEALQYVRNNYVERVYKQLQPFGEGVSGDIKRDLIKLDALIAEAKTIKSKR